MIRPDPQTCGWTALTMVLATATVVCFTIAGRAIADVLRERAR